MTPEKFIAFVNKLLQKTKNGTLEWSRCTSIPNYFQWASQLKSFSCIAGSMKISLFADKELDAIRFVIKYDNNLPATTLEPVSEDERQISLRLINYVYDQFPNLEKSIDEFLMEP